MVLEEYFVDVGGGGEVVVDLERWMGVEEVWICVVVIFGYFVGFNGGNEVELLVDYF